MLAEGTLLRIYMSESAKIGDTPAYRRLVELFMEKGFPGCTAYRGIVGYGHEKKVRTVDVFRLSLDLPIVIDVVDTEEKISAIIPEVEKLVEYGLVTTQKVGMIRKLP
jgi:uncharacterized protein